MNIIHIYTDGSWNNMTKHMGIGIYAKYKNHEIRYSKYIGTGTNNIAELTAIKIALQKLTKYRKHRIKIITDSKYCIGVLSKNWKLKANIELIAATKKIISRFADIRFEWVKGHDKSYGNKQADKLAIESRKKGEKKYGTGFKILPSEKNNGKGGGFLPSRATFVYKTKVYTEEEIDKINENNQRKS